MTLDRHMSVTCTARHNNRPPEATADATAVTDAHVRQWLALLHRPDRLAATGLADLLVARGLLMGSETPRVIGAAAAQVLRAGISRLRQPPTTRREEHLPHVVLTSCFVEGNKMAHVANNLRMSQRQLSRERARAIGLLRAELDSELRPATGPCAAYQPEPIPRVDGHLRRSALICELRTLLDSDRLVVVTGPMGIGKTSLAATLATDLSAEAAVLWYRFRPGLKDTINGLVLEFADVLASEGTADLAGMAAATAPDLDVCQATRLTRRGLAGQDRLLVFDDFHLVEHDVQITGLIDELVTRLPRLRVLLLTRHGDGGRLDAACYRVPNFSPVETLADLLDSNSPDGQSSASPTLATWAAARYGTSPRECLEHTDALSVGSSVTSRKSSRL